MDDEDLRSCNALLGYHVEATDGGMGEVKGLLVDEETWAIRYLIAETSSWWFGHEVLIAPQWIRDVSWPEERVSVDLTRQAVRDASPYDSCVTPNRDQDIESSPPPWPCWLLGAGGKT